VSQQTPGSLTGRPPSGPSNTPFWHMQHTFHMYQGEQPTGGQIQMWPATLPRSGRPYSGTHSPLMVAPPPPHLQSGRPPLEVAMLQPAPGTPIGRQSSGYSATPLTHPTHVLHLQRSEAHRRAIQIQWQHGCGLACHIGARVPHHREQPHCTNAWQQGGIAALQPFWQSHHPVFQALQQPLQPRVSGTTATIIIITIIKTRHTTVAQWPMCSPAPASTKEWHFAASPRLCMK